HVSVRAVARTGGATVAPPLPIAVAPRERVQIDWQAFPFRAQSPRSRLQTSLRCSQVVGVQIRPRGGIGRHGRLKICCPQGRGSSTLPEAISSSFSYLGAFCWCGYWSPIAVRVSRG